MNFRRLWSMFMARNREFFRDRAAFGWNFLFPFLIIAGFAIIFGGDHHNAYKVGVFPCDGEKGQGINRCLPESLSTVQQLLFVPFETKEQALDKLKHHKIDLLVENGRLPLRYWMNETAPKGYVVEKMILGALAGDGGKLMNRQATVAARQIRYIDWLFPGIIGMNIMFSALYGVGFVVVRYRKNGVLKRLKATPLTAFEYLSAQILSRLFVLVFSTVILWFGCRLIFSFHVEGSYLDLCIMFLAGCLSLTSLGLVISSRGTSEEFTNGLLNFITWPMMFLSEVWFSMEGAPQWVINIAKLLPLTHLLSGVRKIANDGATLGEVGGELFWLGLFTFLFLSLGAMMFSWNK